MKRIGLNILSAGLIVVAISMGAALTALAQKLTAEEIVAKHLESIAKGETREKIKNQVVTGTVEYRVLRQGTGGSGKVVLASDGNKLLFGMSFNIPSYQAETFIHDGKKSKIAFAISNARSNLGDFVYRYQDVLSEGLFGGSLVTSWTMADLSSRKGKVDADGTKKIDGREAYVLRYLPNKGSDVEISIYIDKQNFQHLRTQYRRVISAIQGPNPDASAQQREQIQMLVEDFSDFRIENGINRPHSYRLYLMLTGAAGTREYEYKATFTDFLVNQQFDPATFRVDAN